MVGIRKDGIEIPIEVTHIPWRRGSDVFFTAVIRSRAERRKLGEILHQRNRDLTVLNRVTQSLTRSVKAEDVLRDLLDVLLDSLEISGGAFYLVDEASGELTLTIHKGLDQGLLETTRNMPQGVASRYESPAGGQVSAVSRLDEPGGEASFPRVPSSTSSTEYVLPLALRSGGKEIGMMVMVSEDGHRLTEDRVQLLEAIAAQVGMAVENACLFEKVSRLSMTDELTGLYNHRHLDEVLEAEIARRERYGGGLSLAMLDLDGFKEYNDNFGHVKGDELLRAFGKTIRSALRKTDMAFRYGGDEFVIILPVTDGKQATRTVCRIRSSWSRVMEKQSHMFLDSIGFSAGIAQLPQDAIAAEALISRADAALYHSKRFGKDICSLASDLQRS